MKQTVYLSDFRDAFNRMDRGNQFSYEALELIYDYLEEVDPDSELDVIAICCDLCEMTYEEAAEAYSIGEGDDLNPEDIPQAVIDYLNDETSVIGTTDETIIFANF